MTSSELIAYLNGVISALPPNTAPTEEQWKAICAHLQSVFTKETPNRFVPGQGGATDWVGPVSITC